jgi:hypothetical protein
MTGKIIMPNGGTKMKKRYVFVAASLLFLFTGVIVAYQHFSKQEPEVINAAASYVTDIDDPRKLSGFTSDIFIGKVVEKSGSNPTGAIPETRFDVQVIETLKGKAAGQVTVNQQAGYDENGDFFTIDGDRMLIPGKIYLFATVYDSVHDWYTLVPNAGDVPLTVKEEVSASGDGDIVFDESSQKAIEEMKRGIENEIPFEPGNR